MLIYNCKGWLEYCSMSEEQKDIEDANDMEAYMKTCHTLESIRMLSSAYERVWQAQIPIFGEMPEAGSVEKIEKIYNENIKNNKRKMEEYLAGRRAKSYEC